VLWRTYYRTFKGGGQSKKKSTEKRRGRQKKEHPQEGGFKKTLNFVDAITPRGLLPKKEQVSQGKWGYSYVTRYFIGKIEEAKAGSILSGE